MNKLSTNIQYHMFSVINTFMDWRCIIQGRIKGQIWELKRRCSFLIACLSTHQATTRPLTFWFKAVALSSLFCPDNAFFRQHSYDWLTVHLPHQLDVMVTVALKRTMLLYSLGYYSCCYNGWISCFALLCCSNEEPC